ncbi:MAG: hypothetical protein V4671_22655 [Armatimonadota bacterium]
MSTTTTERPAEGLSAADISSTITSGTLALSRLETTIEAARIEFDRKTDPKKFKTEAERLAYIAEAQPEFNAVRARVKAEALATYNAADKLQKALDVPVIPSLPDSQMSVASGRALFVKEDCEAHSYSQVLTRVQNALLSGDAVDKWLVLRYVQARLEREADEDRRSGASRSYPPEKYEAGRLLEQIAATFKDKSREAIREKALAYRRKALDVMTAAGPTMEEQKEALKRSGMYSF